MSSPVCLSNPITATEEAGRELTTTGFSVLIFFVPDCFCYRNLPGWRVRQLASEVGSGTVGQREVSFDERHVQGVPLLVILPQKIVSFVVRPLPTDVSDDRDVRPTFPPHWNVLPRQRRQHGALTHGVSGVPVSVSSQTFLNRDQIL